MSDVISISLSKLRFCSKIGVFEQERRVGNEFIVDLRVDVNITEAMLNDMLEGTISYCELYNEVAKVMSQQSLTLEYVALIIKQRICQRWPEISGGKIEVTKTAPPIAGMDGNASVSIVF